MKKNAKRVISAICAAVISAAPMSALAMEIPLAVLQDEYIIAVTETHDQALLDRLAIYQEICGDLLDEVANGTINWGDAQLKAEKHELYKGPYLNDIMFIFDRFPTYLRLKNGTAYPNEQSDYNRVVRLFPDIIEYVENGGSVSAAIENYKTRLYYHIEGADRIWNGNIGTYAICEAYERYIAKQTANNTTNITDVTTTAPTTGEKNINVYVDNKAVEFDVKPLIINDRTMIPIRKVANAIGISDDNVMYDGASRKAVFANGTQTVILTIDNATASVNGEDVQLDTPATIVSDRTLVPLRFIAETFGYKVDYTDDGTNLNVYLSKSTSSAPTVTPTPLPEVPKPTMSPYEPWLN